MSKIDLVLTAADRNKAEAPVLRRFRPGYGWLGLATVAVLLLIWIVASSLALVSPLFLPSPQAVFAAFADAVAGRLDGAPLADHVAMSLFRVVLAFLLAGLIGVPLGLAMGLHRAIRAVCDPVLEFYRPLPPLSYLPLVVIWFGIGETAKILLIFLACLAPVVLSARAGVRSASQDQINAARALGATPSQLLHRVILPAALPDILVGLRIGMGVGWTTLVAAEMVAASTGIGQMVLNASNFLRTDVVVMGIFVIGGFAALMEWGMRWLERKLVPWKGKI
ncbi:ABC transporter permease subunit [Rhizobium paknamense]|uniref:Taurine transport system permease protein n=1 Tax=Rhizobium paknamense TaxID=1206817 RepID=A0ABU0IHS1_9HYPH|nr:ABC transporter permease subunit [Rhizobium paknamense]MDQ0457804.1 taurine transport system permease protein [Rhizobium paknamense]